MGEPNGRWRATYTPGQWVVLSGPSLLVVMPPAPPKHSRLLNDLWTDVVKTASILDLTHTLGAYRLDALPHFGVLFWADGGMRSLLRGRVKVRDAETGEEIATGEGVQTWAEIGLGEVRRVHIDLEPVAGEVLQLPLMTGAVTASAIQVDATDGARLVFPASEDDFEPVERYVPAAGEPDAGSVAHSADGGGVVVPLPVGGVVPVTAGGGVPVPVAGGALPVPGGAPGAGPEPGAAEAPGDPADTPLPEELAADEPGEEQARDEPAVTEDPTADEPEPAGTAADEPVTEEVAPAEAVGEPAPAEAVGDEAAGDEAAGEEAAGDEAAGDEAAGDEAAGDEAAGDEAAGDEAARDGSAEVTERDPATDPQPDPVAAHDPDIAPEEQPAEAGEPDPSTEPPTEEMPAATTDDLPAHEPPADAEDVAPSEPEPEPEEPVEVADLDLPPTVLAEPIGTDFETEYAEHASAGVDLEAEPSAPGAGGPVGFGLEVEDDGSTILGPPESVFKVPPGPAGSPGPIGAGPVAAGPGPVVGPGLAAAAGMAAAAGAGAVGAVAAQPPQLPGPASPFPGSGQVPYPRPRPHPQGDPPGGPPVADPPQAPGGQAQPPTHQAEPQSQPPAEPAHHQPPAEQPHHQPAGPGQRPQTPPPGHEPGLIAGVPAFGSPPPPPTAPAVPTEHDGETIFTTGIAATHKVSGHQGNRGTDDLVLAAMCSRQHPNPPDARVCSRCGAPVDTRSPQLVNRPVLAVLTASTGQRAELDSIVLVGRSPSAQGEAGDPVLMSVPSPSQDISRTHLKLAASQWEIVVTDLHSTNGTMLLRHGEQPVRLHPGEPVSIGIGAVLDLGDGVTILIDQPR